MKKLLALTFFQLKDKIDLSWVKQTKTLIRAIVFGILKFVIVAGLSFGFLYLLSFIDLFSKYSGTVALYTIFFAIVFVLSLLSTTIALMKSLYFADDNKFLVTLPASSNQLFFSKILVYFFFELKRTFTILVPGTLGFLIFASLSYKGTLITIWPFFWFLIPLIFATIVQVLLGAVLSIPAFGIYKLYKRFPIIGLVALIIAVAFVVFVAVFFITLIPENIDLINQWPSMRKTFNDFITIIGDGKEYFKGLLNTNIFNWYVKTIFGEKVNSIKTAPYIINGITFVKVGVVLLVFAPLIGLLFAIKPFYFKMVSKSFEFDKNPLIAEKKNVKHKKYVTFVNKELKLSFRDFDVSGAYIAVYIIVPILLLLMDKVIAAISTSLRGDNIALAVNVLLTVLPLLASNSMIATLYSKEGRAAYMKKTNPVDPLIPLISKLIFNLFLSVPCIGACAFIISRYAGVEIMNAIMFGFMVLFIQYAHIFYSATQDIMNPQNEAYATTGSDFNNPNETKVTIVAFVGSFVLALASYFLFVESTKLYDTYRVAFIELLCIAAFLFAGSLLLFALKIKAFYYEK